MVVSAGDTLCWDEHMRGMIGKAKQITPSRKPEVLIPFYKALVRPDLEYAVQVWAPTARHGNWGIIMEIEDCQRQFSRIIQGMGLLPYRQRLLRLRLTTSPERRMRGYLIDSFKIIVYYGQNMFEKNSTYQTCNLPFISHHSLRSALAFFSNRVMKYWNQLPLGVRCSASINALKAGLGRFKSSKPDSNGFWEQSE